MSEITPESLVIARPRGRGGRPRHSTEPLKPVTAWVPSTYLDRLDKMALKHDVSVSKLVCRVIEEALNPKRA